MSKRAFTQIEVLVAVAVLSVGVLALFAAFSYHLRAADLAGERYQATSAARRVLEAVRAQTDFSQPIPATLNQPAASYAPLVAEPLTGLDFSAAEQALYRRNVQVARARPADYPDLWRIRVELVWESKRTPRRCVLETYHRAR